MEGVIPEIAEVERVKVVRVCVGNTVFLCAIIVTLFYIHFHGYYHLVLCGYTGYKV
jgi:hypothetical protein